MNIQIRNSIIFLAAVVAILGSVYYGTVQKGMLRKVPHFVLSDYSGHPFDSALLEGTPYVVNVWASWCIFCKWEIVDLATVHRKFPGVPVIAINRGESVDVAKQFTDERHLAAGIVFLLDPQDFFYKIIGGQTMSETIFVDRHGRIVNHHRGTMSEGDIYDNIQALTKLPK